MMSISIHHSNDLAVEITNLATISVRKIVYKKETFIGSFFFILIVPTTKTRKISAPIKIKQTTLLKFCPLLPEPQTRDLIVENNKQKQISTDSNYELTLEAGNIIEIQESHCLDCGSRLKKNGYNDRIVILDKGLGKHEFKLHRKRCKKCGEISPDYSLIARKHGNYHENYRRRARQHYMEGLNPSQIKKVFRIDFDLDISESSIVNWTNEVAKPLRKLLKETPVPSSGYWGYDEIHLNVKGKKRYSINTVDMNTRFVPVARIKRNLGKKSGREVLVEGRRKATLPIHGLIKDCTTNLGKLFKTRSFKNITLQNCLTHVKWIVSAHVKAFAGLSKQSRKRVPGAWQWLLYRFYALIDTNYEADAYIQLEAIRKTVEDLNGEKKGELETAVKQLESWLPKIIANQRNPMIPRTNNVTEGFHKKYEYYRAFKTQMMTDEGVQRILDYRVFEHNFKRFSDYILQYERKYERWRSLVRNSLKDALLRGQGNHFKSMFKKLDAYFGKYLDVWREFFAIQRDKGT